MSDQLTLRREPDKTAEAIVVLNKGAQVEVVGMEANGWQQVAVLDQGTTFNGYVNGKYVTQDLDASPVPAIITEPPALERPSFCASPTNPVEFIICSDSDLSYQDSAMAKSFFLLLAQG